MQVVVITDESLKEELLACTSNSIDEVCWIENLSEIDNYSSADVFIDLLFQREHIAVLQRLLPKLIIVNSVEVTLSETHSSFVRINGWPTFLKSSLMEASSLDEGKKQQTEEVFSLLNKKIEWLSDEPGFITPRVVSMIINEAFISLQEGVSTKEEIDTAMKLGTNYPFGPFEWAKRIGERKILSLLQLLSKDSIRYTPSVLFQQELV